MFSFQNSKAFLLFLLPVLLAVLRKLKILKRITFKTVLANWNGDAFEYKNKTSKTLSVISKILTTVSFVLTVLSFCEPVFSTQEKIYTSIGSDIIFVLDTSPSMMAKDMDDKTRLSVAKEQISELVMSNKGPRFGLVILGTNAAVKVPPTFNQDYFYMQLEQVSVGQMGNGSAIGDGISTAVLHLSSGTAQKKCIILLTDGENNAGEVNPETAAKLALQNNIAIYTVGLGTKGSVPIEYTDPSTGIPYYGYYNSDFNSDGLKKISSITGGNYFEAQSITELSEVLNSVTKSQNVNQNFTYKTVTKELFKNFLIIAIITMIISWVIKKIILKELWAFSLKKSLAVKRILQVLYFVFLVFAYMDFSWGSYSVPVKKSDYAVSFVFDISNSMNAKDCPGENSRMKYAAAYAERLLENMGETSVSVILAKGDGIEAIPLTEDRNYIFSLLEMLSSDLVTVPGTSIENGILKAKNSFPENFSSCADIWVFTDGEETFGQMEKALNICAKDGIGVTIIGFGSVQESDVFAGDGKTLIKTALRENKIKSAVNAVYEKYNFYNSNPQIMYVNSSEKSSAQKLLSQLKTKSKENIITTYEVKELTHHRLFFILAFLCLTFSYIITEFNLKILKRIFTGTAAAIIFSSCSQAQIQVLNGSIKWQQGKFSDSVENYYNALEKAKKKNNQQEIDTALYNLGTAYMMMGELNSAMNKYMEISTDADDKILFAAYYNAGVIAHSTDDFDSARMFFKKALQIDSSRIDAKANLELSMNIESSDALQKEGVSFEGSQENEKNDDMENAIFEHIKENEKKQWKSNSEVPEQNLAEDY